MATLIVENYRNTLAAEVANSSTLSAAVAYITDPGGIAFKQGSTLVTDASNVAIAAGKTDARALERLFDAGVNLFSKRDLHAKTYVFDNSVLVGSANLSAHSTGKLIESGVLVKEAPLASATRTWIAVLAASAVKVDRAFVDRIKRIPVERPPTPAAVQRDIWVLRKPPAARFPEMRAYLLALIRVQLGSLLEDGVFRGWPGVNFGTHLNNGFFVRQSGDDFRLTKDGVRFFETDSLPDPTLILAFQNVILNGDPNDLPPKVVKRELISMPATVAPFIECFD